MGYSPINYDKVTAIMNLLEKQLSYFPPKQNVSQTIPADVAQLYIDEYRQIRGSVFGTTELEQVFKLLENDSGYNLYYLEPRSMETALYLVDNPKQEITKRITDNRDTMFKLAVKAYLGRVLQEIEIIPLSPRKVDEDCSGQFQLTADGEASEKITITIDHDHRITIEINRQGHSLYTYAINGIGSMHYCGDITVQDETQETPKTKPPLFGFRNKSLPKLASTRREQVSIINDYITCRCSVHGSVYADDGVDGVYVFYAGENNPNSFEINYYSGETIRQLESLVQQGNSSLEFWISQLRKKASLTPGFCDTLKKAGVLPNNHLLIECNSAQMQGYANWAYHNPRALMEEINRKKKPSLK